jgi:hypothetical protein
MKVELYDVKLELSSFREIIRVLQEEIREISPSTQPTENKGNELYEDEESHPFSANGEWTTLSSTLRRKPQYTRRNLRQLPIVTSNQFATLGNLNNENEFWMCTPCEAPQTNDQSPYGTPVHDSECG